MRCKALLLVLAAGAALASCPNQCSGHGRCGDFDKCVCFRSEGTSNPYKFSYTGPDCSLRTCPTGRSFGAVSANSASLSPMTFMPASASSKAKLRIFFSPSARSAEFLALKRDQGFSVKIMSPTSFTWKLDEEDYYHDESLIANSDSEAGARSLISGNLKTGVFVYFDATYKGSSSISQVAAGDTYYFTLSYNNGVGFDEADGNTAHQEIECSGQGNCDFATGKCSCAKGYTGAACERVECPNSCSGHGTCQAEARFVTDGNKAAGYSTATYKYSSAVDGKQQFGCKCDNGYRGADCSLIECPSSEDPFGGDGGAEGRDCSGRGNCDYNSGMCQCYKGYTGEACNIISTFA